MLAARILVELQTMKNAVLPTIPDPEERKDLEWEVDRIVRNIPLYQGHLARGYHEMNVKRDIIDNLHNEPHTFVEVRMK